MSGIPLKYLVALSDPVVPTNEVLQTIRTYFNSADKQPTLYVVWEMDEINWQLQRKDAIEFEVIFLDEAYADANVLKEIGARLPLAKVILVGHHQPDLGIKRFQKDEDVAIASYLQLPLSEKEIIKALKDLKPNEDPKEAPAE